jgi:hypothetical protein
MPTVKVCLWNVQNYGTGTVRWKWGADSDLRNRFIDRFLGGQRIEVLLMMEAGAFSDASLRDLALWLNAGLDGVDADWCLSLCGSALTSGSPNPPTNVFDLTYRTDGRSEGYVAAWRSNRAAFDLLQGLHPIAATSIASRRNPAPPARTPLNMVTRGRPTGNYDVTQPAEGRKRRRTITRFGVLGGYRPTSVFPYDLGGRLMNHWPDLPFPTTSTRNPSQLRMSKSRRPAYVVLNLANGGTASQRLCPAAAYHAPSNADQAELGSMMAGLSRELYVTNDEAGLVPDPNTLVHCDSTILGGDFNYSVSGAEWPAYYAFFVGAFRAGQTGGAATTPAPAPTESDADRRTTVQLLAGDHTTPIDSANLDHYFRHKIDLVFTRGQPDGERVNVPQLLLDDEDGVYERTLRAFHTHLTAVVASLVAPDQRMAADGTGPEELRQVQDTAGHWSWAWRPMICGSWGGTFLDWNEFMDQLNNGRFTDARRAAEFYHIFVSDHLPLVATTHW